MSLRSELRCPACHKAGGLWREVDVPGWEAITVVCEAGAVSVKRGTVREVDWRDAMEGLLYGCSCGWEGRLGDLERLGWDDKPLPQAHPKQERIL